MDTAFLFFRGDHLKKKYDRISSLVKEIAEEITKNGDTFLFTKARYSERDTPKNFSIPEVETWRPVTLETSTYEETSV